MLYILWESDYGVRKRKVPSIDIDEESLSEDSTCEQMIENYFKQGFVYDKILRVRAVAIQNN